MGKLGSTVVIPSRRHKLIAFAGELPRNRIALLAAPAPSILVVCPAPPLKNVKDLIAPMDWIPRSARYPEGDR